MSQEERYQYYAEHKLDVFISVSSSESVPSLMMEAMANRIFVCATAVDGVTDVLSNETGLLMPENPTVEQLTAFLEMLCSMDKDKFAARAKLGYECWQQWFNADENCLAFATELSAVENIQPDEPPKEEHRYFHSWKPEEQAAELEQAAAEAEKAETEEPGEPEETEEAEETAEGPAEGPAETAPEAQPEEAPAEIPEEPRPDEPADEAARELLSMIEEISPEEGTEPPEEPAEEPEPPEETPAEPAETAEPADKPEEPEEKPAP